MTSKLSANEIIGAAFEHVFTNLKPLARAAAVPLAVMLAGTLRAELAEQEGHIETYAALLWWIIQFAAIVPFQTQVYRFAVGGDADSTPRFGWPWTMRETRFVVNATGLIILNAAALGLALVVAAGLGATAPDSSGGRTAASLVLVGLPVAILMLYINARLGLVLAAASVGRSTRWRDIWQATSGNGWRIVWIMIVATMPWVLLSGLVQGLTASTDSLLVLAFLGVAAAVISLFAIALPATALGLAYRRLVVGAGPAPPAKSLLA
jgi:hypothetical protein